MKLGHLLHVKSGGNAKSVDMNGRQLLEVETEDAAVLSVLRKNESKLLPENGLIIISDIEMICSLFYLFYQKQAFTAINKKSNCKPFNTIFN